MICNIQPGTARIGGLVAVGRTWGRVRALQNAAGKRVKQAEPAAAVEIIGLQGLPEAGDLLRVVADEKAARDAAEAREIIGQLCWNAGTRLPAGTRMVVTKVKSMAGEEIELNRYLEGKPRNNLLDFFQCQNEVEYDLVFQMYIL